MNETIVLPLEGTRVVNFGHMGTAPMTTIWLADWGAEVIRVESKTRIDSMRFLLSAKQGLPYEDMINSSIQFNEWNRGSKSILANLKKPAAVDLMKRLVKISDVVLENHAPGAMRRLGLGYEDLKEANPGIIYVSQSAMGQEGPRSNVVTYGPTIASLTGKQSMMGYPDGEAQIDYGISDCHSASTTAFYIVNALRYRNRTGEGQYIDLGQVAPVLSALGEPIMDYVMNKRVAGMMGNWRTGFCPRGVYPCRPNEIIEQLPPEDQWIAIAVETEEEWDSLCRVMGNPEWTRDEQFAHREKRWRNQGELDRLIGEWTVQWDQAELQIMLQNAGVPAMTAMGLMEKEWDPHCRARRVFRPRDWTAVKAVPMKAPGVHISGYEALLNKGPDMGAANHYVYGELLGMSGEEIEKLTNEGVTI